MSTKHTFFVVFNLALNAVCVGATSENQISNPNPTNDLRHSKIPKLVRPDGKLTPEAFRFTSRAYEFEALRLVLNDASIAAEELHLGEQLPIATSNLISSFIVGYGMSLLPPKIIGNVQTKDYAYFVSVDHKLSYVEGTHQDEDCLRWIEHYCWPKRRLDTNGAYQLATQWLAAVRMDVNKLNRDCNVRIEPDTFANRSIGKGKFVPLYSVYWRSEKNRTDGFGCVASVKLFSPTKTLVSLRVEESKYILRNPLVFTNLDILLTAPNSK